MLQEHEVHERASLVVVAGEVEIESLGGACVGGRSPMRCELARTLGFFRCSPYGRVPAIPER